MQHHIDLAVSFTAGFDYDTFRADPRTVYAVTRCLEIISEASRRLPDELKDSVPDDKRSFKKTGMSVLSLS